MFLEVISLKRRQWVYALHAVSTEMAEQAAFEDMKVSRHASNSNWDRPIETLNHDGIDYMPANNSRLRNKSALKLTKILSLGNAVDVLGGRNLSSLEPSQSLLNTIKSARDNLEWVAGEPSLLKTAGDVVEENVSKVLASSNSVLWSSVIWLTVLSGTVWSLVDTANHGHVVLNVGWDIGVVRSWQDKHHLAAVALSQDLGDVLVRAVLRDCIISVLDGVAPGILERLLNASNDSIVTLSVVDIGISLALIKQAFNKVLALSSNGDNWVDIRGLCELDAKSSNSSRSPINDQWALLVIRLPWLWESQLQVQSNGGSHSGKRNSSSLLIAGLLWDVESGRRPSNAVLGESSIWSHHLVESSNAVSDTESENTFANGVNGSSNVISGVVRWDVWDQVWNLPVLWVGAGDDDLDANLSWLWLWDLARDDLDASVCGNVII